MTVGNVWKNLALLFVTLVVSFALLEAGFRIVALYYPTLSQDIRTGGSEPQFMVVPDSKMGYRLQPGFTGREIHPMKDFDVEISINSLGFRDKEHDDEECDYCILAVGDSLTFGTGVELEESFLWIVEKKLGGSFGESLKVIKAGVPGYSTSQMLAMARENVAEFKPDLIVVGLVPEEFGRNSNPYVEHEGYIVRQSFVPQLHYINGVLCFSKVRNRFLKHVHLFLQAYSYSFRFFEIRFPKLIERRNVSLEERRRAWLQQHRAYVVQSQETAFSHLRHFKNLASENGAGLLVLIVMGDEMLNAPIAEFCKRERIELLDLYPHFTRAKERGRGLMFPHDFHWNREGHSLAADVLCGYLVERGPTTRY